MDFGIEGVTSMSLDTHKYGLAHKGTSVVLYRNKDIRKHQFTSVTDWTGGLYISPPMAGSRSGAVVAAAWASLITVGREGFVEQTKTLLTLAEKLVKGIESIDDVRILGKPDSCLVAFGAKNPKKLDIYKVNDAMTKKGWHLASLQRPAGLHMCLAPSHTSEMIDQLIKDLQQCIMEVKKGPKDGEGMAPIYGMAESLPDNTSLGTSCATRRLRWTRNASLFSQIIFISKGFNYPYLALLCFNLRFKDATAEDRSKCPAPFPSFCVSPPSLLCSGSFFFEWNFFTRFSGSCLYWGSVGSKANSLEEYILENLGSSIFISKPLPLLSLPSSLLFSFSFPFFDLPALSSSLSSPT